jgi:hypothetical protein
MDSTSGIDITTDKPDKVVREKILGFVSEKAKPCVNKAMDYTLLVVLLLLQFTRCKPPILEDVVNSINDKTFNETTIYNCDIDGNTLLFSSDSSVNIIVLTAIIIGISYGILISAGIWFHASRRSKDLKIHPLAEGLYKFTDKILIIDSALEIPISFFWAPFMTVFLWLFYLVFVIGLFLLSRLYNERVSDDENAKSIFSTSSTLVALSLFKLTGDVSQYWVLYVASTSQERRDMFKESLKVL